MRWSRMPMCALALCWLATTVVEADQVDDFITAQMKAQNIPGLSLAVVRGGDVVKVAGYGLANIKDKTPVTPDTVFHIGSISKPLVAMGVMRLVQDGRLSLDHPISRYLDGSPDAWKPITIRHALTHTSGIVRDAPGFKVLNDQDDAEVLRTAYALPLRFTPGEKWEYSNAGFTVLGEVIRQVTGRAWHEYLKETVFRPFGMTATRPVNTKERIPNRSKGYTDNNTLIQVEDWRAAPPSGGLLSNVSDLAKWDAALATDTLLSEPMRRQMWMPVTRNDGTTSPYGLGWELGSPVANYGPIGRLTTVGHGGSVDGFRSEFVRFVDHGLTIIILMNSDDVDWRAILYGVAKTYLPAAQAAGNQ